MVVWSLHFIPSLESGVWSLQSAVFLLNWPFCKLHFEHLLQEWRCSAFLPLVTASQMVFIVMTRVTHLTPRHWSIC